MEINRINIEPHRENPLAKTKLKVILNEIITPRMKAIGLNKYDGGYLWFKMISIQERRNKAGISL